MAAKKPNPEPIGNWLPVKDARVMCGACRDMSGQMFYKCEKPDGVSYWVTKIYCEPCVRKHGNA